MKKTRRSNRVIPTPAHMTTEQKQGPVHWFPKMLLVMCGIVGILLILYGVFRTSERELIDKINSVQMKYTEIHKTGKDSVWFLSEVPTGGFAEKAADVIWRRGEEIRENLSKYSNSSSETVDLWKEFRDFFVSYQMNLGYPPENLATLCKTDNGVTPIRGHEISFLPKSLAMQHLERGNMSLFLATRIDDEVVSIAAIDWPEKFLAGILYHELFHESRALGAHSMKRYSLPKSGSLENAIEEMRAHQIEASVFNAVSSGEYFRIFDEIISRGILKKNEKELAAAITIDDMKRLDKALGIEDASLIIAQFSYSQYVQGFVAYAMEKSGKTDREKGEFFLWLMKTGITQH